MKKSKTLRGFVLFENVDTYNTPYSIQKSSLATEDRIWLGVDNAMPKIMAKDVLDCPERYSDFEIEQANKQNGTGWVDFYVPSEVLLTTRIHINKQQVAEIIKILQKFVDTGEL
jgi:hypothetical protein